MFNVGEAVDHMRNEWNMHLDSVKSAIPEDGLLVFNIESDSPLALCRFAGLDDSASRHCRMTNRTESYAVRYLRGALPSSLRRIIPSPVKRAAVGFLNKVSRS